MNAVQDAAAPSAAGNAATAQQQQPQSFITAPVHVSGRLGGIVMQLIFIQVVMQLVGSITNPRVQQQQQQVPEQSIPAAAGGRDAAANIARGTGPGAGSMLLPSAPENPFLNLHPNAVLLNAFPPDTPFDAFLHLKYITVLEPSSRRRAAAAAWGPATVESDKLFYSQFFLPSELDHLSSSNVVGDTSRADIHSPSEEGRTFSDGVSVDSRADNRSKNEKKKKEKEEEERSGLSGAWSNLIGSLRQLSPSAYATAAGGSSSLDHSGSRNLFPRIPLWALWRPQKYGSNSKNSGSPAAAAANVSEIASIRLVLPPGTTTAVKNSTGEDDRKVGAERVEEEKEAEAAASFHKRDKNKISQKDIHAASHTTSATETKAERRGDADDNSKEKEQQQEIVYWGGEAVLLWQLLNQKYTYDRWSSSQEQVVSIHPPSDFFSQFPLPVDTEQQEQQPKEEKLLLQEQQQQQQQHVVEKQQQQQEAGEIQQQQGENQERSERKEERLQEKQHKIEEEALPDEVILNDEEIKKRKKRTMLCLVTTIVPHSAYIKGRPKKFDMETAPEVDEQQVLQRITSLMQPMPLLLPREEEEHSLLLGGEGEEKRRNAEKQALAAPIVWHLKNRVDVSLVFDSSQHTPQNLRLGPMQNVKVRPQEATYEPVIYHSDFWLLEKDFIPLNETLVDKPLNLTLSFGVGSLHGWLVQEQLGAAIEQQQKMGLQSTREAMMFKRILIETNPFMLAFSTAFILLHSVFSFFAFKNDMQFWYRNDSMEGLSALSLIFNFVCEVIIGLYLFDSGETSWLILFEICLGIVLSAWKLTKATRLKLTSTFPFISIEFRKSYSDSNTKELDSVAIKWMSLILAPCVLGYAGYALIHNKYRSWYSYIISVLAGSVYTFGFITMTPQLYINYKLKSVDHLPWRALVYRSLNTFVDDVASFLIDMPWMHRLSCFRDDIIFICYLYQRWIYKVDETRIMGAPPAGAAAAPQQLHRDADLLQQGSAGGQYAAESGQLADKSCEKTASAASKAASTDRAIATMTCAAPPPAVAICRTEASVQEDEDDIGTELTQRVRQRQPQNAGNE